MGDNNDTGDDKFELIPPESAAKALAKLGAKKGGEARAKALSAAERSRIAREAVEVRWRNAGKLQRSLRATHKGNFEEHFGFDVDCYVLDDDVRTAVISQRGMGDALGLSKGDNILDAVEGGGVGYRSAETEWPYPEIRHDKLQPWPDPCDGDVEVQFCLTYRGRLPAGRHLRDKHRIRQELHRQLKELWTIHPALKDFTAVPSPGKRPRIERLADEYARCGFRFVPLIGGRFDIACALDILFLRRDQPGYIFKNSGDIDNRIKVLFDALRIPQECSELPRNAGPGIDEQPFYCLLKDDQLITEVKIVTDRLLAPVGSGEDFDDVYLVIHVKTLLGTGIWAL